MAKKIVKFTTTDGFKPRKLTKVGAPFGLKLPFTLNLPSAVTKLVDLGVTCEYPLVVTCAINPLGTKIQSPVLIAPGQSVSVTISAGAQNLSLSEGEIVAHAYILDNTGAEIE